MAWVKYVGPLAGVVLADVDREIAPGDVVEVPDDVAKNLLDQAELTAEVDDDGQPVRSPNWELTDEPEQVEDEAEPVTEEDDGDRT